MDVADKKVDATQVDRAAETKADLESCNKPIIGEIKTREIMTLLKKDNFIFFGKLILIINKIFPI